MDIKANDMNSILDTIICNQQNDPLHNFLDEKSYETNDVVFSSPGTGLSTFTDLNNWNPVTAQWEKGVNTNLADFNTHIETVFNDTESVCGTDNRSSINSTEFPYRATCQLLLTFPKGNYIGTGWFISSDIVATCGHCIYKKSLGGWATEISVCPGRNGNIFPYGIQKSSKFYSVRGWIDHEKDDYDYGFIRLLNGNLGKIVGHYGFGNFSSDYIKNNYLNNVGYPGDKPKGTSWYNSGKATKISTRKIEYMIDTAGGQSGSSVYLKYTHDPFIGVGVHGYGGCPNSARRIESNSFSYFKNITGH